MSQAEALLSTLAETVVEHSHVMSDSDSYFVIDPVTRTMSNGTDTPNVIMQYDHDSEVFTFELPRFVDGHDMMLCNRVIVHWNNISEFTVDERAESTEIDGLRVNPKDSSTVICSWTISRNSTQYAGKLTFLVQYKCVEDGVTTYEWHTDIYSDVTIKSGRNNGEQSVIDYTDIIEQWRNKLFGAGDSVIVDIATASEEQQAAISAKGEETLATIPEDYTATYNMANDALRTRANAVVVTAEGNDARAEDASDDYLRGLHIYGRTEQTATTGRQLAWVNINVANYDYLGVVCSATEDGNISLNGKSTDNLWNRLASADLVAGKTYTLSANKTVALSVWDVTADGSFTVKHSGKDSITFIAPNTGSYSLCIENVANTSFPYVLADIMLNEGSVAYPWEPYSGGVASPSPEWPQNLVSVENPVTTIYGKNLLEPKTNSSGGYTVVVNPDGSVTVTGAATTTNAIYLTIATPTNDNPLKLSKDLKYYAWAESSNGLYIGTKTLDSNGNPAWSTMSTWNKHVGTDYTNLVQVYLESNGHEIGDTRLCGTYRFQIEVGDSFTGFEAYKPRQTLALARTLSAIPVTSGGNYTDSNGQQWIADEIDFERGVYIQRIREIVIDGSQAVATDGAEHNPWRKYIWINAYPALVEHGGLCDKLKHRNSVDLIAGNSVEDAGFNVATNHNVIYFNIGHWMTEDTVEAATTALIKNPLTIKYALKNPIETALTDEELFTFSQLHSNYLVTTALNSENAYMGLVYNADLKAFVDGLLAGVAPIKYTSITLYADKWVETSSGYSQVVTINGVTANSKIDLQPSPDQLASLVDDEVSLTTANDNGTITVHAVGGTPSSDLTMQVLIMEVAYV